VSQVQINNNIQSDTFTELPVSLVLFSLVCIDIVERIRYCRLTGQGGPNTTNAQHNQRTTQPTHTCRPSGALQLFFDRRSFIFKRYLNVSQE
jgi:hypothetical protein